MQSNMIDHLPLQLDLYIICVVASRVGPLSGAVRFLGAARFYFGLKM